MIIPPCAAALVVVCVWSTPAAAAVAGLLVALGAMSIFERVLLRGPRAARSIKLGQEGEGWVVFSGRRMARIRPAGAFVSRWLIILRVDSALGARLTGNLMVLPGMLGAAEFRVLRLWALWGRLEPLPAGTRQAAVSKAGVGPAK